MKEKSKKKGCLPAIIIGVFLTVIAGACVGSGDDIAETTTEITTVINAVITDKYSTESAIITTSLQTIQSSAIEENTTSTTVKNITTTENKTTSTTENQTTTAKNTTTQKPAVTTTKKTTTTNKATTTKKVTTTQKPTTTKKVTTIKKAVTTTKKISTTQKPTTKKVTTSKKVTTTKKATTKKVTTAYRGPETGEMVWIPQSGKKYHSNSSCSNMQNPSEVSLSRAEQMGYTPCKKCY